MILEEFIVFVLYFNASYFAVTHTKLRFVSSKVLLSLLDSTII